MIHIHTHARSQHVTEERKFLQEMMVHETAQSTGTAAYLINRFWLLHVLSSSHHHFIAIYPQLLSHSFASLLVCAALKKKRFFFVCFISDVQKVLKSLSYGRIASEDEIVVEVKFWSCKMSQCRLDTLMDRVIGMIVSAVRKREKEGMNFLSVIDIIALTVDSSALNFSHAEL
jgi:hypothetical protein